MKTNEEQKRAIQIMRARKLIYWSRVRGEALDDVALEALIARGVWRGTGMRLFDWLVSEVGVSSNKAMDLTAVAVAKGLEDEKLYY